ncbi:MAG: nucleotidyltransferase domain-containing protein [Planctomycetes bacterium]|nr:nucleotidyltransferase domain-containing protein [Planctomycetota bacterium]
MILPVGTQVVALREVRVDGRVVASAGGVGVIVKSPVDASHAYRVRFPSGIETSLNRPELAIRKEFQRQGMDVLSDRGLDEFVILRVVVGSRAYGLEHAESDFDRRGVYLPPAELHWSLYGVPEQLENDATQECYWELQKFLVLALKANPNVLEVLHSPLVEHATNLARELLAMRGAFLSKLVYQTYNGYVLSQFRKLQDDLRRGEIKWKHAMHLIRLLLAGIEVLSTGELPVAVTTHRDALLCIRQGAMPWDDLESWRKALHVEFDAAYAATRLPERPDYERANAFLLKARRAAAGDRP